MHVSLDSALGRQRRLNSVGESVLQIAPNAAAAYSLRSLTGGDPTVVRVRRGSDNHEQDFTASQVSAGALTSFVNAPVIAPLDIQELEADGRTGDFLIAKAAYSLRSLGTRQATLAATGDTVARADGKFVAQVRRNVNGDVKSFTADEVTDGTLTSFVNESFTSSLPLDVAGSAAAAYGLRNLSSSYTGNVVEVRRSSDDTTQNFTAAEVTDGTLLAFVNLDDAYKGKAFLNNNSNAKVTFSSSYAMLASNNWSIKFTMILGKESGSGFGILGDTTNNSLFVGTNRKNMGFTDAAGNFVNIVPTGANPNAGQPIQVELFNTVGSGVAVKFDGVTVSSASAVGDFTFNTLGSARGRNQERVIFDLEIDLNGDGTVDHKYAGDGNQNSNWVDQKGNSNGTVSGAVTDYNNEFTDGHVKTWYDQSGNSNDAAQATAASQPKIVSAGALVTGGLEFDGTDDSLSASYSATTSSVVSVSTPHIIGSRGVIGLGTSGTQAAIFYRALNQFTQFAGETLTSSVGYSVDEQYLRFDLLAGASSEIAVNGSIVAQGSSGSNAHAGILIGDSFYNDSFDGSIAEVIIYDSDQSDKRRAIEESIATANGITLGSFSRDGFVKTWYDQSVTNEAGDTATGNHATQATAASQPKIVSNGSLLNELDFDGTANRLDIDFGSNLSQPNSIFMVHQSSTTLGAKNEFFDELGTTGQRTLLDQSGANYRIFAGSSADSGLSIDGNKNLVTAIYNGASSILAKNGTASSTINSGTQSISSTSAIGFSEGTTAYYQGSMREFIIYNSDQTDNRTAIEANIGEAYSIDLPSGVDPGFDQVDGFVETWYDQSGNNRPLIQTTASEQPLIVEDGVFLNGVKANKATSNDTMQNLQVSTDGTNADFGTDDWASGASSKLGAVYVGTIPADSVVTPASRAVIWGGGRGVGSFQEGGVSLQVVKNGTDGWRIMNERQGLSPSTMENDTALNTDADVVLYGTTDNREFTINVNGSGDTETESADLDVRENVALSLFGAYDKSGNRYYQRSSGGVCKECYLYAGDPVANIPALATSINAHYSIF